MAGWRHGNYHRDSALEGQRRDMLIYAAVRDGGRPSLTGTRPEADS